MPDKDRRVFKLLSVDDIKAIPIISVEQDPFSSETPSSTILKVIQKVEVEEEESLFDSPRGEPVRGKRRPMKHISATQDTPEVVMERLETATLKPIAEETERGDESGDRSAKKSSHKSDKNS